MKTGKYKLNTKTIIRSIPKLLGVFLLLGVLFLCTRTKTLQPCDSTSFTLMEETWREFRTIHPFSFQTVGLKHCGGDTCIFVMSEPAEWVIKEELGALFSEFDGHLIIGNHSFGLDGALHDAVGCVKLDSANFEKFEKRLFSFLYGTSYKPFYTDLDNPNAHVYYSDTNLNYDVGQLDWDNWMKKEVFTCSDGEELPFETLANSSLFATNDLYYSKERGFVVWKIRKKEISSNDSLFIANARMFAVDTDLIVKTVDADKYILLIGREREIPVTTLPPLRVETICLLAQKSRISLNVFISPDSAKYLGDSIGWATPINVSKKLKNTELGNLMVLTDIILKSWSEGGHVKDPFFEYPDPNHFLLDSGVAQKLGYVPKYQWTFDGRLTGSLSPVYRTMVDSLTTDTTLCADFQKYFAELNNTDLVRMAQYAYIYQAFMPLKRTSASILYRKILHTQDLCDTSFCVTNERWLETPSITVSNKKWGYGGYMLQSPLIRRIPIIIEEASTKVAHQAPTVVKKSTTIPYATNATIQRNAVLQYRACDIMLENASATGFKIPLAIKKSIFLSRAVNTAFYENKQKSQNLALRHTTHLDPRESLVTSGIEYHSRGLDVMIHSASLENGVKSNTEIQSVGTDRLREKVLRLLQKQRISKEIKDEITIIAFILNSKNYDGETYITRAT